MHRSLALCALVWLSTVSPMWAEPPQERERESRESGEVREPEWRDYDDYRERQEYVSQLSSRDRLRLTSEIYQSRMLVGSQRIANATPGWKSIGPVDGAGRIVSISVHPKDQGTLLVAAAGGGVFRSTDLGLHWTSITDDLLDLSVGAVAYAPSDPQTIYIGSGDPFGLSGIGFLASHDGGATWSLPTSVVADHFSMLSVHPTNRDEIVAATSAGLLRSTNGGRDWTKATELANATTLVRDPLNPGALYATGTSPDNVPLFLRSSDGGATWVSQSAWVPRNSSRISLAIAPQHPSVLYALLRGGEPLRSRIFKSVDAGTTWSDLPGIADHDLLGQQASYDNTIVVSPTSENVVFAGGIDSYVTRDGGVTWESLPFTHQDMQVLVFQGTDLWLGNDGGIFLSIDDGVNIEPKNRTLVTRQFYAISSDPFDPKRLVAGSQDNGISVRSSAGEAEWGQSIAGGDVTSTLIHSYMPELVNYCIQYGAFERIGTERVLPPYAQHYTTPGDKFPFRTVLAASPSNPAVLYTASLEHLWRSTDAGTTWSALSDDSNFTRTARAIVVSASDPDVLIYLASDGASRSEDGGETWRSYRDARLNGSNAVAIDPQDANIFYLTVPAATPTVKSNLMRSMDGGASFTQLVLPARPVELKIDPVDPHTLYLGTEGGVYRSPDQGATWVSLSDGLPATSVLDIDLSSDGSRMRVATFGRGVWERELHPPAERPSFTTPVPEQVVAQVGQRLLFSAAARTPNSSLRLIWSFSDDWSVQTRSTNSARVEHLFATAGTYLVSTIAEDALGGRVMAQTKVNVIDPADDCDHSFVVPADAALPASLFVTLEGATAQEGDPTSSCEAARNGVWFEYTPQHDIDLELYSELGGSISVWTGPRCGPYLAVPGACGVNGAPLRFSAKGGTTLRILATLSSTASIDPAAGPNEFVIAQVDQPDYVRPIAVVPAVAPASRWTRVKIVGEGFRANARVKVNGMPARDVEVIDGNTLEATVFASLPGEASVTVTNPGGNSGSLHRQFRFVDGTKRQRPVKRT